MPGFWAKLLLVVGWPRAGRPLYHFALVGVLLVTAVEASYLFRVAARLYGQSDSPPAPPARWDLGAAAVLGAALIGVTLATAPVADHLRNVAHQAGNAGALRGHRIPQDRGPEGLTMTISLTPLDTLFLVSALTLGLMLLIGRLRIAGPVSVFLYGAQFAALIATGTLFGDPVASSFVVTVLDQTMHWRFDALSWFFAMITIGAAFVSAWYAAGAWMDRFREQGHSTRLFHVALALNVFSMLLLLGSGDFLSLFLGWELVSWASFLMMALAGGLAFKMALRYLAYAFSGAMAVLGAMVLIYSQVGSFEYAQVMAALPQMTDGQIWTLLLLLGGGFGVKMGLLPFHLWQAGAYAETPGPGSAFLGAISSRMGLYAIAVVFIGMVGITRLTHMEVPFTFMSARDLLAWIAVLTIIFPTFTALQQHDARYLLAWHGIGQGGYMLLGLVTGSAIGSAGGIMHVFNHATYQAALFMSVIAVMHRTGTSDLNKLGGLVARMPLSFLVMLFGIIGLAGLPPMNGFVSKWMVYRCLADRGDAPAVRRCGDRAPLAPSCRSTS